MVCRSVAIDSLVMRAIERGVRRNVRHAGGFPERDLAAPVRIGAQTRRHPYLEAHGSRIAAGFPRQLAQLVEGLQGAVAGWIVDGHEPVAILRSAVKRSVRAAAKPERHAPRRRTWIDPDVFESMEVAGQGDVGFRPERLHDPHLLLWAAATVEEILVERDEFDLVP